MECTRNEAKREAGSRRGFDFIKFFCNNNNDHNVNVYFKFPLPSFLQQEEDQILLFHLKKCKNY